MSHRFYSPLPLATPDTVFTLPESVFHHAITVLRLRIGDELSLFDGLGGCAVACISQIDKKSAQARILAIQPSDVESPLNLTLAQCLSVGDKMDWTIEKAVELGVRHIIPLFSAKSQVKLTPERAAKKFEHWQRIIIAACAQCGRNTLPSIELPQTLQTYISTCRAEHKLMLNPVGAVALKSLPAPQPTHSIHVLVGPESGFSPAEISAAQSAGYTTTVLGPRILRTETAGLATLAALQTLWGDF
ncbi:MAG: 16S rRNA (uracil(1498)-N(3))-methyltransferase [Formosimonas sp.]